MAHYLHPDFMLIFSQLNFLLALFVEEFFCLLGSRFCTSTLIRNCSIGIWTLPWLRRWWLSINFLVLIVTESYGIRKKNSHFCWCKELSIDDVMVLGGKGFKDFGHEYLQIINRMAKGWLGVKNCWRTVISEVTANCHPSADLDFKCLNLNSKIILQRQKLCKPAIDDHIAFLI